MMEENPPLAPSTGLSGCTERESDLVNEAAKSKLTIVTGAAGFIGRNVVAELNTRGNTDLLLVDKLGTDEKWQNLLGLRYEDLIDPAELLRRIEANQLGPIDAIIHLGACSATTERDADFLLKNNYHYTRTLCEWCLSNKTRFVYASSAATYGDGSQGYSDDDRITPALRPLNMYGYSKHMFDLWALRNGLFDRIVGLKYFNVFGPYEDHKGDMRSVVQKSYHQIKAAGEVALFKSYKDGYADGEQKRDFIYVKDAVDVTVHFAANRGRGGLFNCGTGKARTWKDLATAVFTAMNRKPVIKMIEMPETLRGKYQYFTEAQTTKLRAAGYIKPFHTLEEGVRDYVQRYLALGA
jgi:ADP-L-glycero-D-manno-heptose 6-epimerase